MYAFGKVTPLPKLPPPEIRANNLNNQATAPAAPAFAPPERPVEQPKPKAPRNGGKVKQGKNIQLFFNFFPRAFFWGKLFVFWILGMISISLIGGEDRRKGGRSRREATRTQGASFPGGEGTHAEEVVRHKIFRIFLKIGESSPTNLTFQGFRWIIYGFWDQKMVPKGWMGGGNGTLYDQSYPHHFLLPSSSADESPPPWFYN